MAKMTAVELSAYRWKRWNKAHPILRMPSQETTLALRSTPKTTRALMKEHGHTDKFINQYLYRLKRDHKRAMKQFQCQK